MNYDLNRLLQELQRYQVRDLSLQAVTGLDLNTMIDIAKAFPLYIKINGEDISIYNIAEKIRDIGCSFNELYLSYLGVPKLSKEDFDAILNGE